MFINQTLVDSVSQADTTVSIQASFVFGFINLIPSLQKRVDFIIAKVFVFFLTKFIFHFYYFNKYSYYLVKDKYHFIQDIFTTDYFKDDDESLIEDGSSSKWYGNHISQHHDSDWFGNSKIQEIGSIFSGIDETISFHYIANVAPELPTITNSIHAYLANGDRFPIRLCNTTANKDLPQHETITKIRRSTEYQDEFVYNIDIGFINGKFAAILDIIPINGSAPEAESISVKSISNKRIQLSPNDQLMDAHSASDGGVPLTCDNFILNVTTDTLL